MMRQGEENEQIKEDFQTVMNSERGETNSEQNGRTTAPTTSTGNEAIEWQNSNSRFFLNLIRRYSRKSDF
jgi:hypothetical protein